MSAVGRVMEASVPTPATPFDLTAAYDDHGGALFGYAINTLRNRPLAEDCVQETFLRAWKSRSSFDAGRGGVRTWLFAIQRNVIIDLQRQQSRTLAVVSGDELQDAPADTPDTIDRLVIVEALAKLSDEHRAAFVAIHVDGHSYSEQSERTGIPVGTLRTRVFYALRALRTHIDGEEGRQ